MVSNLSRLGLLALLALCSLVAATVSASPLDARYPAPTYRNLKIMGPGSTGDIPSMTASPDGSLPVNTLGRSIFEALRGSTFFVRPYLTDLNCGADQTANINTALLVAPAGARIAFPPGCIATSGTVTNQGRHFDGPGRGTLEWRYTATSGTAVKMMGDGARTTNFFFTCTADRATSTAVAVQMADGVQNPRGQMLDYVRARDCYDQVDIQSGEFWSITHFDLYRAKRYGLRIRNGHHPDSGDGSLVGGAIYTDTIAGGDAGVRLESGGGLKVASTKILQFNRGVDVAMADGASTSDIFLDDSVSIEGQYESGVVLGRMAVAQAPLQTGSVINIKVNAQIAGAPFGIQVKDGVGNVTLAPILTSGNYGILITGGYNINVVEGTPVQNMVVSCVTLQGSPANTSVGRINALNCPVVVQDQRTVGAGIVNRYDVRPIVNLAYNATPNLLYTASIPPFRGARVTVQVEGTLSGVGSVNTLLDVLVDNRGSALSTPATVSNVQGGAAPMDVILDTTSTAGTLGIGLRVNSTHSTRTFTGSVTLRIDGKTADFKVLQ